MDKIEVTQADIDCAEQVHACHSHIFAARIIARYRISHTPQSVEPVAADVAALVEAAKRCIQIVERHNQRQNEKVGDVKLILRSALAPFKGQDDA